MSVTRQTMRRACRRRRKLLRKTRGCSVDRSTVARCFAKCRRAVAARARDAGLALPTTGAESACRCPEFVLSCFRIARRSCGSDHPLAEQGVVHCAVALSARIDASPAAVAAAMARFPPGGDPVAAAALLLRRGEDRLAAACAVRLVAKRATVEPPDALSVSLLLGESTGDAADGSDRGDDVLERVEGDLECVEDGLECVEDGLECGEDELGCAETLSDDDGDEGQLALTRAFAMFEKAALEKLGWHVPRHSHYDALLMLLGCEREAREVCESLARERVVGRFAPAALAAAAGVCLGVPGFQGTAGTTGQCLRSVRRALRGCSSRSTVSVERRK